MLGHGIMGVEMVTYADMLVPATQHLVEHANHVGESFIILSPGHHVRIRNHLNPHNAMPQ